MVCGFEFRGMWERSVDRDTGCRVAIGSNDELGLNIEQ
jgi:hypothetical protein